MDNYNGESLLELIKNNKIDDNTALIITCSTNLENVCIKMIDVFGKNCRPEHIHTNGNTALIIACFNKLENVALKLINTFGDNCKPDQISNSGNTALSLAKKK